MQMGMSTVQMTAAEARVLPCRILQKFTSEERPPTTLRRDERIRSVASSFEEITESEEEELQEIPSVSSWNGRSPYALQQESPFAQRRSNSLSNNPLVSPKFNRKMIPPRLTRGFSDPVMRRKSSFPGSLSRLSPERATTEDLLSLPPIPEAATPASPVGSGPTSLFKESGPGKENSPTQS